MEDKRRCLVLLIGFMPNPRIMKRIALEANLFDVHLICWDRGINMLSPPSTVEGYTCHTIQIPASSDPLKRLIPYYHFAKKVFQLLNNLSPSVIHVQGLDMLRIAEKYSRNKNNYVKIIYEVADLHRLLVDRQNNILRKLSQVYLKKQDRKYSNRIDLLIVTSQKYAESYFYDFVQKEKVFCFPNVPDLNAFSSFVPHQKQSPIVVGYIGGVRYKKQMNNLISAVSACDYGLLIAGFEQEPIEIESKCRAYKRGEWIGRFDFNEQAAELYSRCDVMYSVYDADMANVRVALPNKLYEAIYCEIPLIVAKNTYLEEIVTELGVGVGVDHRSPEELIQVLHKLNEDEDYYQTFVTNCKKHQNDYMLDTYNQRLLDILEGWISHPAV